MAPLPRDRALRRVAFPCTTLTGTNATRTADAVYEAFETSLAKLAPESTPAETAGKSA